MSDMLIWRPEALPSSGPFPETPPTTEGASSVEEGAAAGFATL